MGGAKRRRRFLFHGCAAFLAATLVGVCAGAAEAPRISPAELNSMLGNPDLEVIDVRVEAEAATTRIPGAVIENSRAVAEWAGKYPKTKTIVLYCS